MTNPDEFPWTIWGEIYRDVMGKPCPASKATTQITRPRTAIGAPTDSDEDLPDDLEILMASE